MSWFWLFVAPALLLALLSLRGERERALYVNRRLAEMPSTLPPASVIVPVKGDDPGLRENLAALASLDYPDYELLVVARHSGDIPAGVLPSSVRVILAADPDARTSEKIQNLLAAVRHTRKTTQIFAFADSDGLVSSGWLRALAGPLAEAGVGAVSGYRWYTAGPGLWTALRSAWNSVIAGTMGPAPSRFAWGGAMAIDKDTFFELRIYEHWKNAISDDYALSAAVRGAGLRIVWAPGATVLAAGSTDAHEFFSWTRRQLLITRVYAQALWRPALAAHAIYCAGMAATLVAVARGHQWALALLAAQLAPGMAKAARRCALAAVSVPEHRREIRAGMWAHILTAPAATWLWLFSLAASAFGNSITWRGNRYVLERPHWTVR